MTGYSRAVRVRGYIDGVIGDSLRGWAWDEDDPERRLLVRGHLDGAVLGTTHAADPRGDLVRHGIGDGSHGFRIALRRPLGAGAHSVAVVDAASGSPLQLSAEWIALDADGRPLPGITLVQDEDPQSPPAVEAPAGIVGQAGWIFPPAGADPGQDAADDRVPHAAIDAHVAAVERLYAIGDRLRFVPLVVALPDKRFVYRDHLPPGVPVDASQRIARRVAARLRDSWREELLDLLPVLLDARVHGRAFTRTGGELTWTGAFHAYRAVARALALRVPGLEPLPMSALDLGVYEPVHDSRVGRSLLRTVADLPEPWPDAEPGLGAGLTLDARPASDAAPGVRRLERVMAPDAPRLLVAGDEGTHRIARLLAEHASTTLLTDAERIDEELLGAERPGIVVRIVTDARLPGRTG